MAHIFPLTCIRPLPGLASEIATGPHSAMSREEIVTKIRENARSYSRIVHPKALLGDDPLAYEKASQMLQEWIRDGVMLVDEDSSYYLYRLESRGHAQTGLVCRTPVDEILSGRIHAHETIRESKLADLASHIEACGAQIGGPILMAYRGQGEVTERIRQIEKTAPLYDFFSENGVHNKIWKITDQPTAEWFAKKMEEAGDLYIADGHHRVMAGVEICRRNREANPGYTGGEPWNYLACVCFAAEELQILPYARAVKDRNGFSVEALFEELQEDFDVEEREEPSEPSRRGEFLMRTDGRWFCLTLKPGHRPQKAPDFLDAAILQDRILEPLFGIHDPRSDRRLDFIGGTGQLSGLMRYCRYPERIGFLLYPTSIKEVFAVADAEAVMPPKSTWFEPKLCNGLFIYRL